jgi:hypothetical protein
MFERRRFRVSWGAVFAGLVVAAAVNITLTLLGVAIGMGAWSRGDEAQSFGIAALIWTVITLLVSLFIGGRITGRMAGLIDKGDSRRHGVLLWSLFTVLMLTMMAMGLGTIMGGAFSFVGQTASGAAAGAAQGAVQQGGVRGEWGDRGERGGVMGERQEARLDTAKAQAESLKQNVVQNQEEITGAVSAGAWAALILMILSLGAAVVGAASGARNVVGTEEVTVQTVT